MDFLYDNYGKAVEAQNMEWATFYDDITKKKLGLIQVEGLFKTFQMNLPEQGDLRFVDHKNMEWYFSLEQVHHHTPSEH